MSSPQRIQRQRVKGWKMPAGVIYVGRPTKFGNPYSTEQYGAQTAVYLFRSHIAQSPLLCAQIVAELRGKDLACFCRLDQPCHADVLLEVANKS